MNRFLVFIIALLCFFGESFFSGGNVGVSSQCVNGQCFVSASSSLFGILLGIALAIFAIKFSRKTFVFDSSPAGVWRRFGAFFLDFMVLMAIFTPLITLPALIAEYMHTGSFEWAFQRNHSRNSDNLVILPGVFTLFTLMFYYFYKHLIINRQTFGQYVLGYSVISDHESFSKKQAIKRVIFSAIGLSLWPISVIHALFKKRVFWWDTLSNSATHKITSVNKSNQSVTSQSDVPV